MGTGLNTRKGFVPGPAFSAERPVLHSHAILMLLMIRHDDDSIARMPVMPLRGIGRP